MVSRYIIFELLKVFLISLTSMTLLMILVGVAHEALRQGLGADAILKLIPFVLPNALCFAIPGTILFSACCVYGRMSAMNEIIAVKSLGISPLTVIWPALILAFGFSLVAVWLNDLAVSWGRRGVYSVVLQSVEQTVYGLLRTQRSYSNGRFTINVQGVEGSILKNPSISVQGATPGGKVMTLTAKEATLESDTNRGVLIISATEGTMEYGTDIVYNFDHETREIPLTEITRKGESRASPSNYPIRAIPDELIEQRAFIRQTRRSLAMQACFQVATGDIDHLSSDRWAGKHRALEDAIVRENRLQTEPWRRWANGFSCLFFVFVGVPLAIRLKNSDVWTSFALCFIPILVGYYPLLAFGLDRAKTGALPPYAVWLGNIAMLIVGIFLIRKTIRN